MFSQEEKHHKISNISNKTEALAFMVDNKKKFKRSYVNTGKGNTNFANSSAVFRKGGKLLLHSLQYFLSYCGQMF